MRRGSLSDLPEPLPDPKDGVEAYLNYGPLFRRRRARSSESIPNSGGIRDSLHFEGGPTSEGRGGEGFAEGDKEAKQPAAERRIAYT
jgi:hypothetical protein